jgi:hypothetical protein
MSLVALNLLELPGRLALRVAISIVALIYVPHCVQQDLLRVLQSLSRDTCSNTATALDGSSTCTDYGVQLWSEQKLAC